MTSEACKAMINIINDLQTQLDKIIKHGGKKEIPKFKYADFLSNLKSLQLEDISQIATHFKNLMDIIREHIPAFTKKQKSYLASITTISDLINQMQKVILTRNDTNKIKNQFLYSDYIQSIDSFSNILFKLDAFTSLYHRGLYMNHIPDLLIDFEFSKTYLELFKLKELNKSIPSELISTIKDNKYYTSNLPDNIDELDYAPYKWDENVTPIQQICCSLFRTKKCRYLFDGIMKDLFVITYSVIKQKNIELFDKWINWLETFFKTFGRIDYNISFNKIINKWKNSNDQDYIIESMIKIEKIRQIHPDLEYDNNYQNIYNSIIDLYENLKDKLFAIIINKSDAKDFISLKNIIFKFSFKIEGPLKKPLNFLYSKMHLLSQNISVENYNFIFDIFTSIIQQSTKKTKIKNTLNWPTNQNLKKVEYKRSKLFDSLISYSERLQKVESLEYSPKWMTLCELPEPDALMTEFIKKKSISTNTISCYKSLLRAQLLINLLEIDEKDRYKYCNTSKIISFFNGFINRYNDIDYDEWIKIAHIFSQEYPIDFCISIPNFEPFDILSLLVNPLTKKPGFIFNNKQCPQELIEEFYKVYEDITQTKSKQTFWNIYDQIERIIIVYIKTHHHTIIQHYFDEEDFEEFNTFFDKLQQQPNIMKNIKEICEQIRIVFNIIDSITTKLHKDQYQNIEHLDFSDIYDIDFDRFDEYINQNPYIGFYITQFPQVKNDINQIIDICRNNNDSTSYKFPLSLFEFRIFSHVQCIQFQIPDNFPPEYAEQFQEFIYNHISFKLTNKKDNEIIVFSNYISFLLNDPPSFFTYTCYSEYLRNIIIDLISESKEAILKKEIMEFIKKFLPKILDKLGSQDWMKYILEELRYNSKDEVVRFLTNPWRFALEDIFNHFKKDYDFKEAEVQKVVETIINMIQEISSDEFINKLKECAEKDENELQDKIYLEFMNYKTRNEKETEAEVELNKYWIYYSKNIKSYLAGKIQTLSNTSSDAILQPDSSFEHFHDFFSKRRNYLPCRKTEVIAIKPYKSSDKTYTLHYNYDGNELTINFISPEGKVMLFLPPKNILISDLNLHCDGTQIFIDTIRSDTEVIKFKNYSMKLIEKNYTKFDKCFKQITEVDYEEDNYYAQIIKKFSRIKILFGDFTIDEFIEVLENLNIKYQREYSINIYAIYKSAIELDKLRDDVLDLDKYANILFPTDHKEKPHNTTIFLSEKLSNIIIFAKKNIVITNFEIFNDEYIKKHSFFFDENNYFNRLHRLSTMISLRPKNIKSYGIEVIDLEMNQIKASEQLLTPSIFKNKKELNVTIKKIEVVADPLYFGIDISPLQIKLENFTEEEIICEFSQVNSDLPIPQYRNESGFLIIEIPVESICKSCLNYTNNDERSSSLTNKKHLSPSKQQKTNEFQKNNSNKFIDQTFVFNGIIKLTTINNPNKQFELAYNITLHYISLTVFISIKHNHFFAFNKERIEIIPFLAVTNSKLIFEKFTDKAIKRYNMLDNISELNDNKAQKPEFSSRQNASDERSIDIITSFIKENKKENSYLSMNYEIGITKEKTIRAGLHINTQPKLDILSQVSIALYSDPTNNFKTDNILINVGNLNRRVYFIISLFNTSNEPISPKNVILECDNHSIHTTFDKEKNINTISPNQYGYATYFFEVRYSGYYPYPGKEKINGRMTVTINRITQTLNFKYRINAVENQNDKLKCNVSIYDFFYYNQNNDDFQQCNIKNINRDQTFRNSDKQILISPFCFSIYDKTNSSTKVEYDFKKGTFSRIYYDITNPIQYEVFGFFPESRRFMTITIDKPEKISMQNKNIYLIVRIKDEPNTYFSLFCPMKLNDKNNFDVLKCSNESIFRSFTDFFMNMLSPEDKKVRHEFLKYGNPEFLFDNNPLPYHLNLSFVIDLFGKGRKQISFKEVVNSIVKFTGNIDFRDHFMKSVEKLKSDPYNHYYSFISALNELINKRYDQLQGTNFYINPPIPFSRIKAKQEELFQRFVLNEQEIDKTQYIKELKNTMQKTNNIEKEAINKFTEQGMTISPIIKWNEIEGITASNEEELRSHKLSKLEVNTTINALNNENSEYINNNKINLIEFPEKITIQSLYEKLNEILLPTYFLPFNVYSLKITHQPLDRARVLLNQIISIFFWIRECKQCFPFSSFSKRFHPAFTSMIQKLYKSGLRKMNFPHFLFKESLINEFVQIPAMPLLGINFMAKFKQPGLTANIEFTPKKKNDITVGFSNTNQRAQGSQPKFNFKDKEKRSNDNPEGTNCNDVEYISDDSDDDNDRINVDDIKIISSDNDDDSNDKMRNDINFTNQLDERKTNQRRRGNPSRRDRGNQLNQRTTKSQSKIIIRDDEKRSKDQIDARDDNNGNSEANSDDDIIIISNDNDDAANDQMSNEVSGTRHQRGEFRRSRPSLRGRSRGRGSSRRGRDNET